jgi:hypothetical protein
VQILIEGIDNGCNIHKEDAQGLHMLAAFTAAHTPANNIDTLHDGFLNTLPKPTNSQEEVEFAAKSNTLHVILPTVDGQEKIEAILNLGCQVVAKLEEVCNALTITYDPSIQLSMVLANGGVDQTLGLAQNVAFIVGEITLYLQVHILHLPTYSMISF